MNGTTIILDERDLKKKCPNCKENNVMEHVRVEMTYFVKKEVAKNFECWKCKTKLENI